jgi:hypothetical protein
VVTVALELNAGHIIGVRAVVTAVHLREWNRTLAFLVEALSPALHAADVFHIPASLVRRLSISRPAASALLTRRLLLSCCSQKDRFSVSISLSSRSSDLSIFDRPSAVFELACPQFLETKQWILAVSTSANRQSLGAEVI